METRGEAAGACESIYAQTQRSLGAALHRLAPSIRPTLPSAHSWTAFFDWRRLRQDLKE